MRRLVVVVFAASTLSCSTPQNVTEQSVARTDAAPDARPSARVQQSGRPSTSARCSASFS